MLHAVFAPEIGQALPSGRTPDAAMRVTPIGRTLRVASDRAPSALHLMSLVRTGTEAVITVVMRIHWSLDRTVRELALTRAGPSRLPYDQLWAVDDHGARYTVRFEGGQGGMATWLGIARLSPVPPRGVRRLDLVGDGTRLIQLCSGPGPRAAARPHRPPWSPRGPRSASACSC